MNSPANFSTKTERIDDALRSETLGDVAGILAEMSPGDVAYLISSSPPDYRDVLLGLLEPEQEAQVVNELPDDLRNATLIDRAPEALAEIVGQLDDDDVADILHELPDEVTGQVLTFWSIAISVGLYVLVSLATCRRPFDLDRMLHRDSESAGDRERPARWWERLGFDRRMTTWDRIVTAVTIAWPVFFTAVFAVGMARHLLGPGLGLDPIADASWLEAWRWWLMLALATAIGVTAWFLVGGLRDLFRMFRLLREVAPDDRDDGRVVGHRNADEADMESARDPGA